MRKGTTEVKANDRGSTCLRLLLVVLVGLSFSACGQTEERPDNYQDPGPPGPMVRLQIPDEDERVDALELVCAAYKELLEEGVGEDQIMLKTAERAVERGGRPVVLQTERWGTLLPPELYFDIRNRAKNKEICEPFVAFLKRNVEKSVDEVREHRRIENEKRAARTKAANEYRALKTGMAPPPVPDEELMSVPPEEHVHP